MPPRRDGMGRAGPLARRVACKLTHIGLSRGAGRGGAATVPGAGAAKSSASPCTSSARAISIVNRPAARPRPAPQPASRAVGVGRLLLDEHRLSPGLEEKSVVHVASHPLRLRANQSTARHWGISAPTNQRAGIPCGAHGARHCAQDSWRRRRRDVRRKHDASGNRDPGPRSRVAAYRIAAGRGGAGRSRFKKLAVEEKNKGRLGEGDASRTGRNRPHALWLPSPGRRIAGGEAGEVGTASPGGAGCAVQASSRDSFTHRLR